jgi:hypothetical protein
VPVYLEPSLIRLAVMHAQSRREGEGLDQVKGRKSCGDQRSWCALAYCIITSQTHIYTGRGEMYFRSSDAARSGEGGVS